MNENLDLTKILDGCPEGTKFYSTIYGEVRFVKIDYSLIRPIIVKDNFGDTVRHITSDGRVICDCGECTLFPSKDQRDWLEFERFWGEPMMELFDHKMIQAFDQVLVRNSDNEKWQAALQYAIPKDGPSASLIMRRMLILWEQEKSVQNIINGGNGRSDL